MKSKLITLMGLILILTIVTACKEDIEQEKVLEKQDSETFYGAIIRYNGNSDRLDIDTSYQLAYEILTAQTVETELELPGESVVSINLFPEDQKAGNEQINYSVYEAEQKYILIDEERRVAYKLHSYYSPVLNGIIDEIRKNEVE